MKNFMKLSALAAAMAASAGVSAADVKLGVTGRIVPPACTVTLANGGAVSYGAITIDELKADEPVKLATKTLATTIECASNAKFALQFIDNNALSKNDKVADVAIRDARDKDAARLFGMGTDKSGNKIGGYYLRFDTGASDQDGTAMSSSVWSGGSWKGNTTVTPEVDRSGWRLGSAPVGTAPPAVSGIAAYLSIYPGVAATDELDVTDRVRFAGDVSIVLHYL
ncbi:DUF1120 domain-containing protein [Stenotrophomonas sp. CFBP 13718]|uniref:DUF1120 domain-containing protein n=1 Tax=Stenotrophomonas sp. CFBP 13718 TaxID=2775304 RepID=UPI00178288D9|nr:DUF1120 domain-containing protein [Stenotrophomonas sp. CFBP 13718]MBD8694915.1 DUF1120 domain-containing protein [Stenotrophomonas sp. CFBP 13718]